jgi:predicted phage terminase large subunit-like protein
MVSSLPLPTLARASPAGLALAVDERLVDQGAAKRYAYPDHIRLIDREIVAAVARAHERQRRAAAGEPVDDRPEILLIEVPPRHGKSTEISEYTPAWFVGTFPDRHVILCSYESDFASSWGLKARTILEEHGRDLYGVELNPRSSSAKRWGLRGHRGGMITAGVGGPITGMGADLLIIDDPIKNAEQAMSEVIREKQWDWWLSTARTRLQPGAVVIVLLTRWHEDDIAGRMLASSEEGGDPVTEIRLPAIAEEDDPLGRPVGEALWPQRYSAEWLLHTRKVLGPYWFSAMYQGKPTPDEGGIFGRKYFHYWEVENGLVVLTRPGGAKQSYGLDWIAKFQTADLAASEKEQGDYTVLSEWWVTPDKDLLLNSVTRDHIPVTDQPDFFLDHHTGAVAKIESIGYQSGMVRALLRRGFPAEPVFPDKDKVTRAGVAAALYKGGKVYHRRGAEWLHDYEAELLAFPAGEHDDQVDTLSYAARALPDIPPAQQRQAQRDRGQTISGGLGTKQL